MPEPLIEQEQDEVNLLLWEEASLDVPSQEDIANMEQGLNPDQRNAFEQIKTA